MDYNPYAFHWTLLNMVHYYSKEEVISMDSHISNTKYPREEVWNFLERITMERDETTNGEGKHDMMFYFNQYKMIKDEL